MAFVEISAEVRSELDKCMRCGQCMSVCPIYATEKSETSVARGKIAIAQAVAQGVLEPDDPEVASTLANCLLCRTCMEGCPSKVRFDRIMLELRAAVAGRNGPSWLQQAFFGALADPELLDGMARMGAVFQGLVMKSNPRLRSGSPRAPLARLAQRFRHRRTFQ